MFTQLNRTVIKSYCSSSIEAVKRDFIFAAAAETVAAVAADVALVAEIGNSCCSCCYSLAQGPQT